MKMKLIIDCDTGCDDAQAIMLVLSEPMVDVIGITCVAGNTSVRQAALNTLRVLTVCKRLDIPVYIGSDSPLMSTSEVITCRYHGSDGMGDVVHDSIVNDDVLSSEHAAVALVRMVNTYPGELTLLALAPLTNVALAIKLDPLFGQKLKNLVVMGGNYSADEGSLVMKPEFNFATDPEAADVVLSQLKVPADKLQLVPFQTCMSRNAPCLSWEWCEETLMCGTSEKQTFHRKICRLILDRQRANGIVPRYTTCDPCAALVAIKPTLFVGSAVQRRCSVVRDGIDKRGLVVCESERDSLTPNVSIVTQLNFELLQQYLVNMLL